MIYDITLFHNKSNTPISIQCRVKYFPWNLSEFNGSIYGPFSEDQQKFIQQILDHHIQNLISENMKDFSEFEYGISWNQATEYLVRDLPKFASEIRAINVFEVNFPEF